ncbi:unnamed protein product [Parascedosporium putredinis]|uniref:SNF2 N-terminal domain-containing protein n=1 Tax=Parascedosporium putredinis TaxID=1442378 RepID=A0A9P1M7X9_9PEZI|nr:unnamed protein product [Parascedosporium putredinis]CAI7992542.1 unnamed protein product [Parascedosporium putredinis]
MLMDYDCFLQRPDIFDDSVPYQNPQSYSESASQANTGSMLMGHDVKNPSKVSAMATVSESQTAELLACASGPEAFTEQKASDKLSTELKWFQKKALAMMAEKESGKLQATEFPSVWTEKVNCVLNKRYGFLQFFALSVYFVLLIVSMFVNNVTLKPTSQRPDLCLGGLLADDMGLGKSLTTLALIAGSLSDDSSNTRRGLSTIIVAPLSTLPNWENQIRKYG